MNKRLPRDIKKFLVELTKSLQKIIDGNLVGIYLYGSLAMGGFNPDSSDADILLVVKDELTKDNKTKIIQAMLSLSEKATGGGFELTIIKVDTLKNFKYPTPRELYFTTDKKDIFLNKKIDFDKKETDEGLAINLAIVKKRGVCVCGVPISKIFPEINRKDIYKSLIWDFDWSYNNVMNGQSAGKCWVPSYAVLNSCRLIAYVKNKLITSKIEGGRWGIKNFPKEYIPIIRTALNEYRKSSKANQVDAVLLKKFLNFTKDTVHKAISGK